MPLMRTHRRHLGAVAAAMLILVMIGAVAPDPTGAWQPFDLHRDRMPLNAWLSALPSALSRYVTGNFGYGRSLPFLRGVLAYTFASSSDPRVYIGQRAHLYYTGEGVVGQSTGALYRIDEVKHFVDMADALRHALAPSGAQLLVAMPPNAQSVATGDLPGWWRPHGPLEYDLAVGELRRRDIATLDLKSALAAMPDATELYRRTDSHWRRNAALTAFNLAMHAIGHSEWALDPAKSLSAIGPAPAGDLARLIGLQDYLSDSDYSLTLASDHAWSAIGVIHARPYGGLFLPYAFEQAPEGPRVLVLGDSFTLDYWRDMLLHIGAARIGWMPHGVCSFDFADVARFQPTHVILAPTERYMPCPAANWPDRLAHEVGDAAAKRR